jgi:hypothetical protein
MDPIRVFAIVVLVSLPTVMYGGYSLLTLLGRGRLTGFQETFFRAGHAHAGVLLVFGLAYLAFLSRTDFGPELRWIADALLGLGIIAQSGGMFVHMAVGKSGTWSVGNSITSVGAVLLAAACLLLAYGVLVTSKTL